VEYGLGFGAESDSGTLQPETIIPKLTKGEPLVEHGLRAAELFSKVPGRPLSSVAIVPMKMRERLMGWLGAISLTPSKRFDEGQRKLLSIVSSRAAAAIENARLYEDLQATFQQTINSLARTIDKMDRYTAGHSERVAVYAVALARRLGLPEEQIEIVRHSALMHDIGKVGCAMNLNKPGKLTQEEYEIFKKHPVYGREILDPIRFLEPVIPGVHLHHERWDGRGYPLGLTGNEIPLIARIFAVVDVWDALRSDRPYRKAWSIEETGEYIRAQTGTHFDPKIVDRFLELVK
jgi:putative nucleotidyltransferase with HDIG domain